eukprot:SAG31_NODE_22698_length_520_cov_0.427553_1_plen_112_part_10
MAYNTIGSNVPAAQSTHDVSPAVGWTKPDAHSAHTSVPSSKVPASQVAQDVWPAVGWTEPNTQFAHTSDPLSYVPALQLVQEEQFCRRCGHWVADSGGVPELPQPHPPAPLV